MTKLETWKKEADMDMLGDEQAHASNERILTLIEALEKCREALEPHRYHLEVDDGWYSCPKAENHIDVFKDGEIECRCGADKVIETLAWLDEKLGRG